MVKFKLTFLGKSMVTCCIVALVLVAAGFIGEMGKQSMENKGYVTSAQQVNSAEFKKTYAAENAVELEDSQLQGMSTQGRTIIYFEPNLAAISQEGYEKLDVFLDVAENLNGRIICIEGNSATLSAKIDTAFARTLSIERAKAVAEYFKHKGIHPERIEIIGNGASNPAGENSTEQGRVLNRRVEAHLKK